VRDDDDGTSLFLQRLDRAAQIRLPIASRLAFDREHYDLASA
jgi:hypothetical protein